MKPWLYSYTAYSIGCAAIWAVIFAVVSAEAGNDTLHTFLLDFLGWVIGWLSATIAGRFIRHTSCDHR